MAELFAWLVNNWMTLVGTLGAVVLGASLIVKAIAPLTATDTDDKLVVWLNKVHEWLSKVALNPKPQPAPEEPPAE